MFCNRCGSELNPQTNLCPRCSQSNQKSTGNYMEPDISQGMYPEATSYENSYNPSVPPSYAYSPEEEAPKKSSTPLLIAILCLVLAILLLSAGFVAAYKMGWISISKEKDKSVENKIQSEITEDTSKGKNSRETLSGKTITRDDKDNNLEEKLNSYIDNGFYDPSDVAVCVIDNKTNHMYSTDYSREQYVAWGLYLPIYMALGSEYPGQYEETRSNIVSSNISTCNKYSNIGIDQLGGFNSLNNILAEDFNLFSTTYGRKFGVTNSSSDNYTTPEDAALILKELNDSGEHHVLKDINAFGIVSPDSAHTIHAHYGSENRNVNRNFNAFAIIKGDADICIAIMTKNQTNVKPVINDIYEIAINALR